MDRDEMLRVLRAFEQEGLEYVLIGAAAMGFHGLVRATEDMDVFIRAADLLGEYPAVRYYPQAATCTSM